MGGHAFRIPAQRLSTDQFTALVTHAKTRLATLFPGGMEALRYTVDKADHGDVDMLCACEWAGVGMKGLESGVGDEEVDLARAFGSKLIVGPGGGEQEPQTEPETELEAEVRRVRGFCQEVAKAIGAVKWVRSGYEISNAIPCHLVPGAERESTPSNDVSDPSFVPLKISDKVSWCVLCSLLHLRSITKSISK